MAKIFVTRKIPFWEEISKPLYDAGHEVVVYEHNKRISREELIEEVSKGYDGLLCLLTEKIDQGILLHDKQLKIIANYAVGFDNIDVAAARAKNIMVTNTPSDAVNESVAEFAWTLMLALARQLGPAGDFAKNVGFRGWEPDIFVGADLKGKTLGVIGTGRIGSLVAAKGTAFAMNVLTHSRSLGTKLEDILAQSDFVTLHVPLTPETTHLINSRTLAACKTGAYLINTARGPVIDEADLLQALRSGKLAGAGLDVWENEPSPRPELVDMPNVILTPHIASATQTARLDMGKLAISNLLSALSGQIPPNLVK